MNRNLYGYLTLRNDVKYGCTSFLFHFPLLSFSWADSGRSRTGKVWPAMYPGKNARLLGAEVEFVEAQYMVFTREAFKCWRSLIDLEKNRLGLAMDQLFKSICKVALGRVDTYTAHHTNDGGKGKRYNYTEAKAQRDKYVLELQNKFPGSYEAFGFGSGGRSLTRSPWYINKLSVVIQWVFDVNS